MPKLKNVTAAEIDDLVLQCHDILQDASDFDSRGRQGYCEAIAEPVATASAFLSASRALAELAAFVLIKVQLEEQSRELERKLTARLNPEREVT